MTTRTLISIAHEEGKDKIENSLNHIINGKYKNNNAANGTKSNETYKVEIVWRNVILFLVLHGYFVYALYLLFLGQCKLYTFVFHYVLGMYAGVSVTMGAHRLWAHRTYTATLPFRILLMIGQTIAVQNDLYIWTRDHRVHHKFTDQDADPHNSKRGFFFSHIGWLMMKKHPDVTEKGKLVDMSDILQDPVVRFQRKYYIPLVLLLSVILPIFITHYFFGQSLWTSTIAIIGRLMIGLHITWLVNSGAHMWGMKPFDKYINPTDNKAIAFFTMGEGWHNYHHVFPWDYKSAEFGNYYNVSTFFLHCAGKLGLAYDFKTASEKIIKKRALRTGDHSHWSISNKNGKKEGLETEKVDGHYENQIWGWGDKDMEEDEIIEIKKSCRQKA